jgi:hypothetical protein
VILAAIRATGPSRWRWLAAVPVTLAPAIVDASALARPYSLATMLVTFVIYFAWIVPREGRLAAYARWTLVIVATALAAWTDYLAGAAALLAVTLPQLRRGAPRIRWLVPAIALASVAALVPGALEAASSAILPDPTSTAIDLRPRHGLGHGNIVSSLLALAGHSVLGVTSALDSLCAAMLVALSVACIRTRRPALSWTPLLVIAIAVIDSAVVATRARNVLFLPFGTAVVIALLLQHLQGWHQARAHD